MCVRKMCIRKSVTTITILLLALMAPAGFAQVTPTQINGFRNAPGEGTSQDTNVIFTLSMTLSGEETLRDTAYLGQDVEIKALIRPETEDIGAEASLVMVDVIRPSTFTMRTSYGNFVPWDGRARSLEPYLEGITLEAETTVDIFTGKLGATGDHRVFIGFLVGSALYFTPSALRFKIEADPVETTAREQAIELFESTISETVVQARCIQCHVAGGQAANQAIQTFVPTSNADHLTINFQEFEELHTATSTNYILAKVQGMQNHGGFLIFSASSTQYQNLQDFLELLDQAADPAAAEQAIYSE